MKTTLRFEEPKKSIYRDYSNFSSECFKDDFDDGVSICQEKTHSIKEGEFFASH